MSKMYYPGETCDGIEVGEFGAVEYEGKFYKLTNKVDFTYRILPPPLGERHFEMAAPAVDQDGNRYTVYWIFEEDIAMDPDEYDYNDINSVKADS
ncbi:MAG: hypothetical protein ACOX0T_03595 [Pelotomaculum sp.]